MRKRYDDVQKRGKEKEVKRKEEKEIQKWEKIKQVKTIHRSKNW